MKFSLLDDPEINLFLGGGTPADLLKLKLMRFYSKKENIIPLKTIVSQKHRISLRLIDSFVTNYSKHHNIIIPNIMKGCKEGFPINNNYKQQLQSFGKVMFDPFRREHKITFVYGEGPDDFLETSLGQMNIFKWLIEYRILDFMEANLEKIEVAMNGPKEQPFQKVSFKLPPCIQSSKEPRIIRFE
jgi:hypothetical protein